jgi:aldehyde dehydrogenase
MPDVMERDDAFLDKAIEGFTLFAFNKGEVCTCPSRALIHESIFEPFMEKVLARVDRIRVGDPLDPATQMGPQASQEQLTKILDYIDIGKREAPTAASAGSGCAPGAIWTTASSSSRRCSSAIMRCASSRRRFSARSSRSPASGTWKMRSGSPTTPA